MSRAHACVKAFLLLRCRRHTRQTDTRTHTHTPRPSPKTDDTSCTLIVHAGVYAWMLHPYLSHAPPAAASSTVRSLLSTAHAYAATRRPFQDQHVCADPSAMVVLGQDFDHRPPSRHQHTIPTPMPPTPPADEKPYHAKRPHRKSRLGCRNCKTRKVKCDEKKPSCRNCTLRKETCVYPSQSNPSAPARSTAGSASASASASASTPVSTTPPIAISPVSVPALPSAPLRVVATPISPSVSSASPLSQRTNTSPLTSTSLSLTQRSPVAPPSTRSRRLSHDDSSSSDDSAELVVVEEPPFRVGGADAYDMKLLWFYTTETYSSFSIEAGKLPYVDNILKSSIVKFAFQSSFLMDCILGLSALHMQSLHMAVPLSKTIGYRARAFAGYRKAIEKADPKDFPALLACSLFMTSLSSEIFREADMKPLYIIDWMVVWRGIGLILELLPIDSLFDSGLAQLFSRPAFDLNQSALSIPANLLFMVTSIKEGDQDYPDTEAYYNTLKFLGGLYRELETGFGPVLSLRIITWFTFLPGPFVELAKKRRPRALVILAHYLCFMKLVQKVWWLNGVADRGIQDIIDHLSAEWQPLLRVPRSAIQMYDRVELAKLIQGNHAWEPRENEKTAVVTQLAMVNNAGEEVAYDEETGWVPLSRTADPEELRIVRESTPRVHGRPTASPRHTEGLSPPKS